MKKTLFTFVFLLIIGQWARAWDGSGTDSDPYLVKNAADWEQLAADVADGESYSGKVFRMTRDINISFTMVGYEGRPFSGTFDGDSHTLTFNIGTGEAPILSQQTAPFRFVSGATIRHLKTDGNIYVNAKFAAGIVSWVAPGNATTLSDCHSSVIINSFVNGDGSHGGLVAEVNSGVDSLVIERSSFTGRLVNAGLHSTTHCGGFVGWAKSPVHIQHGTIDQIDRDLAMTIRDGATFARMDNGVSLTLESSFTTTHFSTSQGTLITNTVNVPEGVTYEFVGEPTIILNGTGYYTSGCRIRLTVPEGTEFDHWECTGFISDPWTPDGIHQLKDLKQSPLLGISTQKIPEPETARVMWGVNYRYLSRKDYHYFISDEDCEARGWKFENGDDDANLVVYSDGKASEITAITGYQESGYNSDGVQIHNDLVGDWRNHTHLGMIAPHAFQNSTKLETLYFKDTDANNYNALLPFDFYICEGAFDNCPNFKELKMMQYTTKGSNHWEALSPDQVISVADDAFNGCDQLRISVHNSKYQDFMSSDTWKAHRNRFIIYEATTEDFTVNGVKYHRYRNAKETDVLKNDESGKSQMMDQLRTWNADYQQFSAASLLETKDGCNVYYTSVIGVDNDDIDEEGGTMRIYNDPGEYYNYKTIQLQRDAIAGNEHVKNIEFWQTNGRSENSYSDLKFVIPNGALKDCKNLKELRMFYFVEDGTDHWETLGPKDVIPGNNIFGLPSPLEKIHLYEEGKSPNDMPTVPEGFRIIVSPDHYPEFLDDPNWQHYVSFIQPVDFEPTSKKTDFTEGGLTYSYMTSPGGILQTSQVVSQDVSWWTAPRIAIEVALMIATLGTAHTTSNATGAAAQTISECLANLNAAKEGYTASLEELARAVATSELLDAPIDYSDDIAVQTMLGEVLSKMNQQGILGAPHVMQQMDDELYNYVINYGILNAQGSWKYETMGMLENAYKNFELANYHNDTFAELLKAINDFAIGQLTSFKITFWSNINVAEKALKAATSAAATTHLTRYGSLGSLLALATTTNTSSLIASQCWGGPESFNSDLLQKGMRNNILSNIHQLGAVGGGYVITTPQKNLVYHTYIKEVGDNVEDAIIYAGFDNDNNVNSSNRTMTFAKKAFRDKTNLKTVRFHENPNGQTSNTGMPLLLTIPDSAFVGCTNLTEFSTLLQTKEDGTRALGPENFVLAGDSIFAGLDSLQFHIIIDPLRKQDFLDNASWAPLQRYFVYESASPSPKEHEYGAWYAFAYEKNSIKKRNKVSGHLIEHTVVTGPDNDFIKKHQGAVKLCNDIGVWNNYQLDEIMPKAFKGNENLRSVSFTDLYGAGAYGDVYTDFRVHIGDSAFVDCKNLLNLDLLYMVTDGDNHIELITPQMLSIGDGVFDGTNARLKMTPKQVEIFDADSTWAPYKDRFKPCIIKLTDPGVKNALEGMSYYDPANTGTDPAYWNDYCDLSRIADTGFNWLDNKFNQQMMTLHSFPDFKYFESVDLHYVGESWFENCYALSNIVLPSTLRTIRSKAFKNCANLPEIVLPEGIITIEDEAFANCQKLNSIIVLDSVPAFLSKDVFHKHEGLHIYVPAPKVYLYKQRWSEYADYIVGDNENKFSKEVFVTDVGQLAEKLGLEILKVDGKVRYLHGPYAKYDSLTIHGPLNGLDLAIIRHLAGADAYDSAPTDGRLRYLNLWDADIKKDKENSYNGNWVDEYIDEDNLVPDYLFENCTSIETVIFPQSATKIGENIFEEATSMKRIAVGRKTTSYDTDILQDISGIEELVFLTEDFASNNSMWPDPWEAPIQQVYTLPSQLGRYMGDPKLIRRAGEVMSPFSEGEDAVMFALADAGHFFLSEYLKMESAEDIFHGNTDITHFDGFELFSNVKELDHTFQDMTNLESVRLSSSIERIGAETFSGCDKLKTLYISCDSVPELGDGTFDNVPDSFKIFVPKKLCKLYRETWPQYAHLINPDDESGIEHILTIVVKEPNTVAQTLNLMVGREKNAWNQYRLNKLSGDYSKIRRLKIIGPISGGDFDVLRHLSGYSPWGHCRNYSGKLEYIDLYDAQIVESEIRLRSQSSAFTGSGDEFYEVEKDILPKHAFLKAYNLKTLILPRACKKVEARAMQECEGLESLVVGDDCEDFNWNALDDDAMLSRMYILAKKKVNISTQFAVWRWLCNNYNPTFDAFYVLPSLYEDYLYDDAYTGNSWQRTNNISKGAFEDDASFRYFASHAAATIDDLSQVYSVDGWSESHQEAKDLTLLGYTAITELHAEDMQKLTRLEKVSLPVTLRTIEDSVFSKSPNLRYVDLLMCDSTLVVDTIRTRGFAKLGIDSLRTLVYLPKEYGMPKGVNIVVADSTNLRAETFRLLDDKDYCVPYAFHADKVENTRTLPASAIPYTLCVPYDMDKPDNSRIYALSDREGSELVFSEIPSGKKIEAFRPYLIKVSVNKRRRTTDPVQLNTTDVELPVSKTAWGKQEDAPGYSVRGTLNALSNAEASELGAYVLQDDGDWHPVRSGSDEEKKAYVPAFRMYLLPSARNANSRIGMELEDIDDISTFKTVDIDGTERIYDLSGRELPGVPEKGIYIHNGKKHISR